jgi:hypothetical protein
VPSQGPNSASTFTNDATTGTVAWATRSNANVSDDNYAVATLGFNAESQFLRAEDFGFSIPGGATIDGVVVGVERSLTLAFTVTDSIVRLYTGSFVGSNKATGTTWPTSDTYEDHGGAADVWGATLTPAIVNASTFGVGVSCIASGLGADAQIDHIRITVFYSDTPIFPIYDMLVT